MNVTVSYSNHNPPLDVNIGMHYSLVAVIENVLSCKYELEIVTGFVYNRFYCSLALPSLSSQRR